jgi:hypothetical protein
MIFDDIEKAKAAAKAKIEIDTEQARFMEARAEKAKTEARGPIVWPQAQGHQSAT